MNGERLKSYQKIIAGITIVLLIAVAPGCTSKVKRQEEVKLTKDFPVTISDDAGRKVTIEKEPRRIVSLAPSNTEILFVLGLDNQVVGVDDYSDYPPAAKEKEKIGGFSTPNIEKIVSLKPDLVLATGGVQKSAVSRLEELNVNVFILDSKTVVDAIEAVRKVGVITQKASQAEKVSKQMEKVVEQVKSKTKKLKNEEKPKVFYELYKEPLMSAGAGTFIDDMIRLCGGKNIAAAAQGEYPQFSVETLLKEDPDVYLAASGSMSNPGEIRSRPGFENLKVVKEGRVFIIEENLVNRPGPRIVIGLKKIAEAIHPEAFK